jgi:hypothetical protein
MQQPFRRFAFLLAISAALVGAPVVHAKGGGHSGSSHASVNESGGMHRSTYAVGAERNGHGRIARSQEARHQFKKAHPCPSTGASSGACPGYVIDHVQPLKRGGADAPGNMQWQTKEEAKLKDRNE